MDNAVLALLNWFLSRDLGILYKYQFKNNGDLILFKSALVVNFIFSLSFLIEWFQFRN